VRVPATSSNLLILGLTSTAREALLSVAESVELRAGDRLIEPGIPLTHAYFPQDVAISAGHGANGNGLGCGVIGREGLVGIELIHEMTDGEFSAEVQCAGRALKVAATFFRRQLDEQPAFHARMKRYVFMRLLLLSQDVHCFSHHLLEGRLASQLLLARARGGSNHLALTHQMLARVLDVRRSGITLAAAALRRQGMVRYARGHIEILDGEKLESAACSCYAATLKTYTRLLGVRGRTG
jgi:CRP-like cAMP-binding protein